MNKIYTIGLTILVIILIMPVMAIFVNLNWHTIYEIFTTYFILIGRYAFNTALVAILTIFFTGILGYTFAYIITIYEFPYRKFWKIALLLPFAIPSFILAIISIEIWDTAGIIQNILRQWGIAVTFSVRNPFMAAFTLSVSSYCYVYLLLLSFMGRELQGMITLTQMMGYNELRCYLRIAPIMIRPALISAGIIVAMEVLGDYGTMKIFGVSTLSVAVLELWQGFQSIEKGAVISAILVIIILITLYMNDKIHKKLQYNSHNMHNKLLNMPKKLAILCNILLFFWLFISFIFPLIILIYWALQQTLTAHYWYEYSSALWNSVWLGLVAGIITLIISLLLLVPQRFMDNNAYLLSNLLQLSIKLIKSCYSIPGSVLAIGVVIILGIITNFTGYNVALSIIALILAYFCRFSSSAIVSIENSYKRIAGQFDYVSLSLNQTQIATFKNVHLPLLRPAMVSGFLLVFVDVIKELPASLTLKPYNFDNLATKIWFYAHDERVNYIGIPAILMVMVGFIPVYFIIKNMEKQ